MSIDAEAVARFLAQSRSAHSAYQQAKRDRRSTDARNALQTAADARQHAHDADPAHSAPAWSEDGIPGDHADATHAELHESLTQFYTEILAR